MYNQERSQCYPNDCGDALTNPNYNECSDQQTACADAAWRYWMWDCWIEVDRQLAECRSYCGDTYGYPEVTVNNGRLEFATMTEYEAVIDRLEDEYEAHSAAFYDQYDILTDDEVYELEIAQGFDDLKPYKDFESFFGFSSLRASTTNEIEPVASLSVVDESEQTLLDVYGNVKIGGTIINMATVIDEGEPEPEICYSSYKKDAEVVLGSNKIYEKIWGRKNDTRFPARDRAMLKVLKYNNKRKATKMNVRGFGNAYNEFCFGATPFDTDWKKNSDKRRKRMCIRFWPVTPQTNLNGIFYYKSGNITGQFRANGNEFTLVW